MANTMLQRICVLPKASKPLRGILFRTEGPYVYGMSRIPCIAWRVTPLPSANREKMVVKRGDAEPEPHRLASPLWAACHQVFKVQVKKEHVDPRSFKFPAAQPTYQHTSPVWTLSSQSGYIAGRIRPEAR
ncbi:hypothetical protein MAPG_02400 [Magnaporthiopsis poae ATCC 64411]|uniref:Uncharacterized protein n=1 Tax=Magnaporthiopsis poae (strain ATCC 64411 / 73-15) TaxID=644358 RepID=A0A0C4DR94_MAGP6|nr:hypothetical protein MAPG_02400 [Magnaporthiopsis poae ATCC 64411]